MTDAVFFSGHILIAMPALAQDPFFNQSVIYIIDHDEKGAMGLIINKPTDIDINNLLDELDIPVDQQSNDTQRSAKVMLGGPVQREAGLVLHRTVKPSSDNDDWQSSLNLDNQISLTSSSDILEAISKGKGPEELIVALGYASWSAGQLEDELQEGSWLIAPYAEGLLFEQPFSERWESSIEHIGIKAAQLSPTGGQA